MKCSRTFHSELSVGFGVGRWEVDASRHVHANVVEDQHVSGSFLLNLNILKENKNIWLRTPQQWKNTYLTFLTTGECPAFRMFLELKYTRGKTLVPYTNQH